MKFSKVTKSFGRVSIKALLPDGTVLYMEKLESSLGCVSYSINRKPVKNTGKTNKAFMKYFDNFAEMHKKL